MGLAALMVIWSLIVKPRWSCLRSRAGRGSTRRSMGAAHRVRRHPHLSLVLNRKRGGLPLPQMLLLFGGFTILFISDPGGEFAPTAHHHDAVHLRLLDRDLYVRRDAPALAGGG